MHLTRNCRPETSSAQEDRDCEFRRFFPTIGTCPTEATGKDRTTRGIVRADSQSPSCRHDRIPEAIEFEEEGSVEPPSETIVRMALAVIPRHDVGAKRMAGPKRTK